MANDTEDPITARLKAINTNSPNEKRKPVSSNPFADNIEEPQKKKNWLQRLLLKLPPFLRSAM